MDIYQRLKQDHQKQKDLAAKILETEGNSAERRDLYERFKAEITNHANAEEQTLYASMIETVKGQEMAQHSIAEHKDANDLVEELEEIDMGSGAWLMKFKELAHEIEHHVDEEEEDVFPLAKELIEKSTAENLAKKFENRKALQAES